MQIDTHSAPKGNFVSVLSLVIWVAKIRKFLENRELAQSI
jgi:hypothetical protein